MLLLWSIRRITTVFVHFAMCLGNVLLKVIVGVMPYGSF